MKGYWVCQVGKRSLLDKTNDFRKVTSRPYHNANTRLGAMLQSRCLREGDVHAMNAASGVCFYFTMTFLPPRM